MTPDAYKRLNEIRENNRIENDLVGGCRGFGQIIEWMLSPEWFKAHAAEELIGRARNIIALKEMGREYRQYSIESLNKVARLRRGASK